MVNEINNLSSIITWLSMNSGSDIHDYKKYIESSKLNLAKYNKKIAKIKKREKYKNKSNYFDLYPSHSINWIIDFFYDRLIGNNRVGYEYCYFVNIKKSQILIYFNDVAIGSDYIELPNNHSLYLNDRKKPKVFLLEMKDLFKLNFDTKTGETSYDFLLANRYLRYEKMKNDLVPTKINENKIDENKINSIREKILGSVNHYTEVDSEPYSNWLIEYLKHRKCDRSYYLFYNFLSEEQIASNYESIINKQFGLLSDIGNELDIKKKALKEIISEIEYQTSLSGNPNIIKILDKYKDYKSNIGFSIENAGMDYTLRDLKRNKNELYLSLVSDYSKIFRSYTLWYINPTNPKKAIVKTYSTDGVLITKVENPIDKS